MLAARTTRPHAVWPLWRYGTAQPGTAWRVLKAGVNALGHCDSARAIGTALANDVIGPLHLWCRVWPLFTQPCQVALPQTLDLALAPPAVGREVELPPRVVALQHQAIKAHMAAHKTDYATAARAVIQ